jgi:hypothetical protein
LFVGIQYEIQYLMADGAKGITAAKNFEFPYSRRLMCWAHAIRQMRQHRKMMPSDKWKVVEGDILALQLSFDDELFNQASSLLLKKWRSDPDLHTFSNYFEHTWLNDLKYWYEGAAVGYPSTNNGLESLNAKIKQQYTLRNKLPLSKFLATMEIMLHDWSVKSIENEFQTFPKVTVEQEKEAWKWLKGFDKNSMLHWYEHSYVVPSNHCQGYNSSLWLKEYATFSWQTFEDVYL